MEEEGEGMRIVLVEKIKRRERAGNISMKR
jgi:hypothetical protein